MSLTLGQAQEQFSRMLGKLLIEIPALGFQARVKEVLRTQAEANVNAAKGIGIAHSLHLLGLAADIVLTKNGVVLTKTEQYEAVGKYWESIGGSWGGRFHTNPDGNHFSLEYNGVR